MNVKACLVEKVSAKTGKQYCCVEIYITDEIKKTVFLSDSEIALLKLNRK